MAKCTCSVQAERDWLELKCMAPEALLSRSTAASYRWRHIYVCIRGLWCAQAECGAADRS